MKGPVVTCPACGSREAFLESVEMTSNDVFAARDARGRIGPASSPEYKYETICRRGCRASLTMKRPHDELHAAFEIITRPGVLVPPPARVADEVAGKEALDALGRAVDELEKSRG